MRLPIILIIIGAVLILGVLAATLMDNDYDATEGGPQVNESQSTTTPDMAGEFLSNQVTCSTTDPDVRRVVGAPYAQISEGRAGGTATAIGSVVSRPRTGQADVETAYLSVASATPETFLIFNRSRVERGNTVNVLDGDQLLFKIGIFENGMLQTSAAVSPAARSRLEEALGTGETVVLTLQVPIYEGTDAPVDFTFACAIALANR